MNLSDIEKLSQQLSQQLSFLNCEPIKECVDKLNKIGNLIKLNIPQSVIQISQMLQNVKFSAEKYVEKVEEDNIDKDIVEENQQTALKIIQKNPLKKKKKNVLQSLALWFEKQSKFIVSLLVFTLITYAMISEIFTFEAFIESLIIDIISDLMLNLIKFLL